MKLKLKRFAINTFTFRSEIGVAWKYKNIPTMK